MPNITTADLQVVNADLPIGNKDDPRLQVKFDPANPLKPGKYTFQLQVEDDADPPNRSEVATLTLTVFDDVVPKAVIKITKPTPDVPRVRFGQAFVLSGEESTDDGGGTIVKYIWKRTA